MSNITPLVAEVPFQSAQLQEQILMENSSVVLSVAGHHNFPKNLLMNIKRNGAKMTLDWKSEDEDVLGKDLVPGDCLRGKDGSHAQGLVMATTCVLDEGGKELKAFYADEPGFQVYDINCPSEGLYSCHLDLTETFKVVRSRETILYIYKTIEYSLLKRAAQLQNERNDLMDIQRIAVRNMNDRCDKLEAHVAIQKEM